MTRRDVKKRYNERKKKKGLCLACNNPTEKDHVYCKKHLEKRRIMGKKYRESKRFKYQNGKEKI